MQDDNIENKLPLEHSIPLSEPHFYIHTFWKRSKSNKQ